VRRLVCGRYRHRRRASCVIVTAPVPAAGRRPPPSWTSRTAFLDQRLSWRPCGRHGARRSRLAPSCRRRATGHIRARGRDNPAGDLEAAGHAEVPAGDADVQRRWGPGAPRPGHADPGRSRPRANCARAYDYVGIDPTRGRRIDASRHVATPQREARRFFRDRRPGPVGGEHRADPAPVPGAGRALPDADRRACSPFLTTWQTVRDLEFVRQLLREPRLSYLGFSAGTLAGRPAYPCRRSPQHARSLRAGLRRGLYGRTGRRSWAGAAGGVRAPLQRGLRPRGSPATTRPYAYGTTAAAVLRRYERRRAALAQRPIEVADRTVGPRDGSNNVIASGLYSGPRIRGAGRDPGRDRAPSPAPSRARPVGGCSTRSSAVRRTRRATRHYFTITCGDNRVVARSAGAGAAVVAVRPDRAADRSGVGGQPLSLLEPADRRPANCGSTARGVSAVADDPVRSTIPAAPYEGALHAHPRLSRAPGW